MPRVRSKEDAPSGHEVDQVARCHLAIALFGSCDRLARRWQRATTVSGLFRDAEQIEQSIFVKLTA